MSQYNFDIKYIKETDNTVADSLSQYSYNSSSTRMEIPAIREETLEVVVTTLKLETKESTV